jgi:hypothetical protein
MYGAQRNMIVHYMHLVPSMNLRRTVVKAVINHRFSRNTGYFLTGHATYTIWKTAKFLGFLDHELENVSMF